MKFALNADGAQAMGQGIGSLFKAYAMAPLMRQQAENDAMLKGAQIYHHNMSGNKAGVEAELKQNELQYASNPLESAMLQQGLPTALAPAFKTKLETGKWGGEYTMPTDGVGPVLPAPADDDTVKRLGQSLSLLQRMYGSGSKVNQGAEAALKEQEGRYIDQVANNPGLAAAVGKAYAATSGNPLFDNVGNTGFSIDRFTGNQAQTNSVLAKLFGDVERSKATENLAQAGSASASAGLSNARRDRVISGLDKPVTIVDDESGQATVTAIPTKGEARSIGVAAPKGTGVDATNAKTRNAIIAAIEKEQPGLDGEAFTKEVEKRLSRRGLTTGGNKNPAPAASSPKISAQEASAAIAKAKAAIQNGAPRNQVIERLKQNGIDPTGL